MRRGGETLGPPSQKKGPHRHNRVQSKTQTRCRTGHWPVSIITFAFLEIFRLFLSLPTLSSAPRLAPSEPRSEFAVLIAPHSFLSRPSAFRSASYCAFCVPPLPRSTFPLWPIVVNEAPRATFFAPSFLRLAPATVVPTSDAAFFPPVPAADVPGPPSSPAFSPCFPHGGPAGYPVSPGPSPLRRTGNCLVAHRRLTLPNDGP